MKKIHILLIWSLFLGAGVWAQTDEDMNILKALQWEVAIANDQDDILNEGEAEDDFLKSLEKEGAKENQEAPKGEALDDFLEDLGQDLDVEPAPQEEELPEDLLDLSLEDLMALDASAIGILGAHTHYAGQWMVGYRYMYMYMDGNYKGTSSVGDNDVLRDFPVVATRMRMEMQMAEVMYAPTDDLTVMLMMSYITNSMDHKVRNGLQFTTGTQGFGDLIAMLMYTFYREDGHQLFINLGISFPTGNTDKQDGTPFGRQKLPYPMQLGSGTYDPIIGFTYSAETRDWGWGGQAIATLRFGHNNERYRLGNEYKISGWVTRRVTQWFAPSLRVEAEYWDDIEGRDPELNTAIVATADPHRRAGTRVDAFLSLQFYIPRGLLKGHRFAVEAGVPIFQSLNGPQLGMDVIVNVAWEWTFDFDDF